MGDPLQRTVKEELERFQETSENESDYSGIKHYLELILAIPFGK